jgi:hypothetical protein
VVAAPTLAVDPPTRVAGVDFSGARDARENVWIAECERRDGLRLTALAPASDRLAPVGDDPRATTEALVDWTRTRSGAVGFDFPFSLPAAVARGLGAGTWRETLDAVAGFADASAMDDACGRATPGDRTYARRATDEAHDSFSPYHFFVKRQTYHGMGGVLAPLVAEEAARVLPFDLGTARAGDGDRPVVLETYPAAVVARLGGHRERYKGTGETERERRAANLAGLREHVTVPDGLADRALADPDGDALDALAAAVGTALACETGLRPAGDEATWRLEGAIYPLARGPHDTLPRDGDGEP